MSTTSTEGPRRVAVIGAGLVGSLAASMLASRGWSVDLFEGRTDPRLLTAATGVRARSINLALSPRGIESLHSINEELAERVRNEGVKMRGRMVHTVAKDGSTGSAGQDYGIYEEGEYISSISREMLSIYLLDHLDALSSPTSTSSSHPEEQAGSVRIHFGHRLKTMNTRTKDGQVELIFDVKEGESKVQATFNVDLVVGGDGAYSKVRQEMLRGTRFNFAQYYARHAYLELTIPAGPNDTWSISPEHLHIWPRGEFMLIALPNQNKSFTVTLFAYDTTFTAIAEQLAALVPGQSNPVIDLFRKEFPDALALMGEEGLLENWRENPKDGLVTIECSPYHYEDKVVLIGDAAHAMVPFYGQGMNCAFEDVRVLSTILDHYSASPLPSSRPSLPLPYSLDQPDLDSLISSASTPLSKALEAYSIIRAPSIKAIQQLAKQNYDEMASAVLDPFYLLRLSLDGVLSRFFSLKDHINFSPLSLLPSQQESSSSSSSSGKGKAMIVGGGGKNGGKGGSWESLYRMVTFRSGLAYEEAIRRRRVQSTILESLGGAMLVSVVGLVGWSVHLGVKHAGALEKMWQGVKRSLV